MPEAQIIFLLRLILSLFNPEGINRGIASCPLALLCILSIFFYTQISSVEKNEYGNACEKSGQRGG
jgi:hypothetical protein